MSESDSSSLNDDSDRDVTYQPSDSDGSDDDGSDDDDSSNESGTGNARCIKPTTTHSLLPTKSADSNLGGASKKSANAGVPRKRVATSRAQKPCPLCGTPSTNLRRHLDRCHIDLSKSEKEELVRRQACQRRPRKPRAEVSAGTSNEQTTVQVRVNNNVQAVI